MDTIEKRKPFTVLCGEKKSMEERKKALRAHMRKQRTLVDNRDVKERLMTEGVFAALERAGLADADCFFVYMSYSSEARTDTLIDALQKRGKRVLAPRVEGAEMVAVEVGEDMSLSEMGIREPVGQAYEGEIDVAIMPLLAVDEKGNRLGYGGGFYDKFLQKNPRLFKLAYAYDIQLVDEVPSTSTDVKVDAIVTDKRILFIN